MRKLLGIFLVLWAFTSSAFADQPLQSHIPEAQKVGEARMTYMLWDVYDASLYAPQGQWREGESFALKLHYLRSLKGEAIADRSAEEMRKQGFKDEVKLAAWYSQMRDIFPNVKKGSEITGIYKPESPTQFLFNGKPLGEIKDPEFGKYFFDIWLSGKTSEPQLRAQLLGLNK